MQLLSLPFLPYPQLPSCCPSTKDKQRVGVMLRSLPSIWCCMPLSGCQPAHSNEGCHQGYCRLECCLFLLVSLSLSFCVCVCVSLSFMYPSSCLLWHTFSVCIRCQSLVTIIYIFSFKGLVSVSNWGVIPTHSVVTGQWYPQKLCFSNTDILINNIRQEKSKNKQQNTLLLSF